MVRIANISVEEGAKKGTLRVKLVPEVAGPQGWDAFRFMAEHPHLYLCSEVIEMEQRVTSSRDGGNDGYTGKAFPPADAAASCHTSGAFNEFSTLDLHLGNYALLASQPTWLLEGACRNDLTASPICLSRIPS